MTSEKTLASFLDLARFPLRQDAAYAQHVHAQVHAITAAYNATLARDVAIAVLLEARERVIWAAVLQSRERVSVGYQIAKLDNAIRHLGGTQ